MAKRDIRGSVSLSVAVCDHFPDIIERCNDLGWELFSHGVYNSRYFYGMTPDEQPMPLNLKSGKLISVPYSIEMNDVPMVAWNNTSVIAWSGLVSDGARDRRLVLRERLRPDVRLAVRA